MLPHISRCFSTVPHVMNEAPEVSDDEDDEDFDNDEAKNTKT